MRPVALYAGWLTAASGASIGIVLGGFGILAPQVAAVLCLIGVTAVALAVQAARPGEWAYPAGVVWALIGIMAANLSQPNLPVVGLAGLAALLLAYHAVASGRAKAR